MIVTESLIHDFFAAVGSGDISIYNEMSLQHELGIFIRKASVESCKVEFERPVSFFDIAKTLVKKEIDISVYRAGLTGREAVELKFPRNGQYPEQMFNTCKDIQFIEQLRENGFLGGKVVMAVDDHNFYQGKSDHSGIYRFFRSGDALTGRIEKPTGKKSDAVDLLGEYTIRWRSAGETVKYTIISVGSV